MTHEYIIRYQTVYKEFRGEVILKYYYDVEIIQDEPWHDDYEFNYKIIKHYDEFTAHSKVVAKGGCSTRAECFKEIRNYLHSIEEKF